MYIHLSYFLCKEKDLLLFMKAKRRIKDDRLTELGKKFANIVMRHCEKLPGKYDSKYLFIDVKKKKKKKKKNEIIMAKTPSIIIHYSQIFLFPRRTNLKNIIIIPISGKLLKYHEFKTIHVI